MFKNPFSFKGRIRRMEYIISYLIYIAVAVSFSLAKEGTGTFGSVIFFIVYVPLIWFMLAQGAKRCHDLGNSGFYLLIPFYVLWMIFAEGTMGPNSYGVNPKSMVDDNEINDIGKPMSDS